MNQMKNYFKDDWITFLRTRLRSEKTVLKRVLNHFLPNQMSKCSKEAKSMKKQQKLPSKLWEFLLMQSNISITGFSRSKNFQSYKKLQVNGKGAELLIYQTKTWFKKTLELKTNPQGEIFSFGDQFHYRTTD